MSDAAKLLLFHNTRMMMGEDFPKFRMIAADVLLTYCQTKEELAPKRR